MSIQEYKINQGQASRSLCMDHTMELFEEQIRNDAFMETELRTMKRGVRDGISWVFEIDADVGCEGCK